MPFDNVVQFSIPVSILCCFVLSLRFFLHQTYNFSVSEFPSRCILRHLPLYPSVILDLIFLVVDR